MRHRIPRREFLGAMTALAAASAFPTNPLLAHEMLYPPMDLSIVWDRRESVAERIVADHQFQWAAPANYSSSYSYSTQTVYDVGRFL